MSYLHMKLWLAKDRATRIWPEKALTWAMSKAPRRVVLAGVVRAAVEASRDDEVISPDEITYKRMHAAMAGAAS
jgi:hypothetical protein